MAKRPARLEGGRYDGDEHDFGQWPPCIWAYNCMHPGCPIAVHWFIGDLTSVLDDAREQGLDPQLYEKDRLEHDADGKALMIYILADMRKNLDGEDEWIHLGRTTDGATVFVRPALEPA